jgi:hypothetical protein
MKVSRALLLSGMFVVAFGGVSIGQTTVIKEHKTLIIESPRQSVVNVKEIKEDYFPKLQNIEMPKPGIANEESDSELNAAKARIHPSKINPVEENKNGGSLKLPVRLRNFEGNAFNGGIPNDNDIAVSNSGKILSVMNSTVNVYDSTGNLVKTVSLDAFSASLGLTQDKYDPRVLYDPTADRFVVVCLDGKDDATSHIILGFSQTNDPAGNWNLYNISGNPLGDTTWCDYPIITLTKNELFLTLNALQDNKTWQLGFKQDYIWQIDKASGYSGAALKSKLHSGIVYNGVHIRNLCPVQGGSQLTGPDSYFLSDKNFSNKTDSIFLLRLSGEINDPNATLSINLLHAKSGTYGVSPNAQQVSTKKVARSLQTNDARILDAFIENNTIQFVGNSVTATGKAGAMHGIITNASSSPSAIINILGDTLEYGYPSIVYAGIHAGDDDALILVEHTSDTTFAGNSVVYYKGGSYSASKKLFSGSSFIQVADANDRWGDYTGAQRKYNEPGKAWVAANYGRIVGSGLGKGPGNACRISEIQSPLLPLPAAINEYGANWAGMNLYPVPANNYTPLRVTFTSEKEQYLNFRIMDMEGRTVANLLNDRAEPGKNTFTFSTHSLKKGIYLLSITSDKTVYSKKFVVE